jgi:hypothetical protein
MKFAIGNMQSGWEVTGSDLGVRGSMKYVSVLTPPLLVCAAFLIAVVAFLRHEMGSRRRGSRDLPSDDISAEQPIPEPEADTQGEVPGTSERRDDN